MMAQQCCCLFKILESILKYIGDQTELPAVDQEYLTPEINMRADRNQLRLTQHAVNKLREVRLTLFALPQSGCAYGRNPDGSGCSRELNVFPGLKQPWALSRNRFAVRHCF